MTVTDSKGFCQLMTWAIAANPMKVGDPNSAAWEGLMDQWWNKVRVLDYELLHSVAI
jgi:hypothetical protein